MSRIHDPMFIVGEPRHCMYTLTVQKNSLSQSCWMHEWRRRNGYGQWSSGGAHVMLWLWLWSVEFRRSSCYVVTMAMVSGVREELMLCCDYGYGQWSLGGAHVVLWPNGNGHGVWSVEFGRRELSTLAILMNDVIARVKEEKLWRWCDFFIWWNLVERGRYCVLSNMFAAHSNKTWVVSC
jgi:hypothetical protein